MKMVISLILEGTEKELEQVKRDIIGASHQHLIDFTVIRETPKPKQPVVPAFMVATPKKSPTIENMLHDLWEGIRE